MVKLEILIFSTYIIVSRARNNNDNNNNKIEIIMLTTIKNNRLVFGEWASDLVHACTPSNFDLFLFFNFAIIRFYYYFIIIIIFSFFFIILFSRILIYARRGETL